MNILITGGAGFIGSNLAKRLSEKNHKIFIVDSYLNGLKLINLVDCSALEIFTLDFFYQNCTDFIVKNNIEFIFHMGAKSATTEWDGNILFKYNYQSTLSLIKTSEKLEIPLIYASSASVYGLNNEFSEIPENEDPINAYAASKLLVDNYVREKNIKNVVGLRFFNVYGPNEFHKDTMASVILHFYRQAIYKKEIKIFGEYKGINAGEHQRDFVHVDDCVQLMIEMCERFVGGIYNVGTGEAFSYNYLANCIQELVDGEIKYIPFPDKLKGKYQIYTKADMRLVKEAGFKTKFRRLDQGIIDYVAFLSKSKLS